MFNFTKADQFCTKTYYWLQSNSLFGFKQKNFRLSQLQLVLPKLKREGTDLKQTKTPKDVVWFVN